MQQKISYQTKTPESSVLKKYVANFYIYNFDNKINENLDVRYTAFPQSGTDVTFFNMTDVVFEKNEISMEKNSKQEPLAVFLGKYLEPLKVNYKSYGQKITIHFTEFGVINFFPNYYTQYGASNFKSIPLKKLNIDVKALFSKDVARGIKYLESYLLSIYSQNSLPLIEKSVGLLKGNLLLSTTEISEQIGMNKKTFSRQFKKHIGCTVSDFKRITRFKRAARNFFDGKHRNLLQLGHDNGYYDASDFYKQIYRTTFLKPKEFFKSVQKLEVDNGIYIFE